MRHLGIPIIALAVGIVASTSAVGAAGSCQPRKAETLVGTVFATEEALTAISGARIVRILSPGMSATMDFSPDRLTVVSDRRGVILSAKCG